MRMRSSCLPTLLLAVCVAGCSAPGRPKDNPEVPRPEAVTDAKVLYQQNCAGCHGEDGQNGAATNLANPEYQALIDDATLRNYIAQGGPGTLMPPFSDKSGGMLTDAQIDSLVRGIRSWWSKGNVLQGQNAPAYKAAGPGDAGHGQQVYQSTCAQCHGPSAQQPGKNGSVLDGSFLALIPDQTLRTTVIVGRPDLGMPNWRDRVPGHPMSDKDVTDTVAYLVSQRQSTPGQPYPEAEPVANKALTPPAETPAEPKNSRLQTHPEQNGANPQGGPK